MGHNVQKGRREKKQAYVLSRPLFAKKVIDGSIILIYMGISHGWLPRMNSWFLFFFFPYYQHVQFSEKPYDQTALILFSSNILRNVGKDCAGRRGSGMDKEDKSCLPPGAASPFSYPTQRHCQ